VSQEKRPRQPRLENRCSGQEEHPDTCQGVQEGAQERYSFGIYAGRYCSTCWPLAGYRDDSEGFDPDYAGETLEPDDGYGFGL